MNAILHLDRKNDIGNQKALPISDVIKYIFIRLPRVNAFRASISPEELEWYDLISNSGSQREIPESASEPIRDAYERLRVRRTPKEILERQARDMIPSAVVDEMIEDAVDKALDTERHKLAREMLANGISMEKVSLITGFSKEEILSRKE